MSPASVCAPVFLVEKKKNNNKTAVGVLLSFSLNKSL